MARAPAFRLARLHSLLCANKQMVGDVRSYVAVCADSRDCVAVGDVEKSGDDKTSREHSDLLVARALHLAELFPLHYRHRAVRLCPDLYRHLQIHRSSAPTGPLRSARL